MKQAKLQQATKEVEEELRKAKEEAKEVKAEAAVIELRLNATLNEIKAAKALKSRSNLDFSNGATLPFEEYYVLSKKAKELEEQVKERIILPTEQMEAAKGCEARGIEKMEAASETLEEKKKKLREAMGRIEKAEDEMFLMEYELRMHKEEHEHELTTNVGNFDDFVDIGTDRETTNSDTTYNANIVPELKQRKRMFFAKIVMFFTGKKVQSLQ